MNKLIPNTALSVEQLPDPANTKAIFSFAMSFNGYEHFGSLEAAMENARAMKRESLSDLRNELFMYARAARLCDDEAGFLVRYAELLPLFRRAITHQAEAAKQKAKN